MRKEISIGLFLALGCEAVPGPQPPAHERYTVTGLHIPTSNEVSRIGCDLDGDGSVDNALGNVLAHLPSIDPELDFQRAADAAFQGGRLQMTLDVHGDELSLYSGDARLGHYAGVVAGGWGDFGADQAAMPLPVPMDQPAATLDLVHGQVSATLGAQGIDDGVLCGAIPTDEIAPRLYPVVADMLSAAVAAGNQTIRAQFDTDGSCAVNIEHCISADEFAQSEWRHLLDPDLPFGLSFGVGFTATAASR